MYINKIGGEMKFTADKVLSNKALLLFLSPSNPHLRQVNCGFSGIEGLKIALVIQLLKNGGCPTNLLDNPTYRICRIDFYCNLISNFAGKIYRRSPRAASVLLIVEKVRVTLPLNIFLPL